MKHAARRRLMISKNLIMMLVIAVVVSVAIYAWFLANEEVEASGLSASAAETAKIELALPTYDANYNELFPQNSDFQTQINFRESGFIDQLIKDVTSDGKSFIVPTFESTSDKTTGRLVIPDGIWEKGLSSFDALTDMQDYNDELYNYVSLHFYARAKSRNLFFAPGSYLAAGSEISSAGSSAKTLNDLNPYRPTDRGAKNYSADAIVGAMRVSIDVEDVQSAIPGQAVNNQNFGTKANKLIWLPRPDIKLVTDSSENNWYVKYVRPTDTDAKETYRHSFWEGKVVTVGEKIINKGVEQKTYNDNAVFSSSDFTTGAADDEGRFKVTSIPPAEASNKIGTAGYTPKFGQTKQITNSNGASMLTIAEAEEDYYYFRFTLNVWVEGADSEARRAMNDGVFNLHLEFQG